MMAEEIVNSVVEADVEQASTPEVAETAEKTFTQTELDAIIQKEKAKAKRAAERDYQAKMDEAEKLRQMNAEQKLAYEQEKQAAYIAELEAKINRSGLEKEASKMLAEVGILADEATLGFVVKDGAEATQEAVLAFSALVNNLADQKVGQMLKGKTPKKVETTSKGMSPDAFHQLSYAEKVGLFQSDPQAYAQLMKGN